MSDILPHAVVSGRTDARHWRVVLGSLRATFRTGSFARGAELVAAVAAAADELDHHPDVLLRYGTVTVTTVSHDVGALTERDVELARRVSALADERGVDADPRAPRMLEIAVDTQDVAAVLPFWQAALGYERDPHDAERLVDPAGEGPCVWFQHMDSPRPQRNRIHVDVDVPHDVAPERLDAVLTAGGRLVSDRRAPAFWVVADAEGNEVCLCTWKGRGQGD
ncbi:VOC family protein [Actinotalea sp. AC32]|nr:VOC family protein [Actinotalea sp. AC32]